MPRSDKRDRNWALVQKNRSYWAGALSDEDGKQIRWHSPEAEASSQVICISAFGGLRSLPDGAEILNQLFAQAVPHISPAERWKVIPEYVRAELLGETGQGTPTNIDAFCVSDKSVVCIEAKFLYDAKEGFGVCGQAKNGSCAGFYGPGSDLRTRSHAPCRLEEREGKRDPRLYWQKGRTYFQDSVFQQQHSGQRCPFAGSHFQLMRNFLFAAAAAGEGRRFAVVAMVPEKMASTVQEQVASFQKDILFPRSRDHINVATYDSLASMMVLSPHQATTRLGHFLRERLTALP